MKYILTILGIFLLASSLFAQEPTEAPEPTGPPGNIIYQAQIAWGSLQQTLQWGDIPIASTTVVDGDVDVHSYKWLVVPGLVKFEFRVPDFDLLHPQKVVATIQIANIGGPFGVWGIFRVHIRAVRDLPDPQEDYTGDWSVTSFYVPVLKLPVVPRPIRF